MNINFNKSSWHLTLYRQFYSYSANHFPDNFCQYFREVILAFVTMPLWCFFYKIKEHPSYKFSFNIFIYAFLGLSLIWGYELSDQIFYRETLSPVSVFVLYYFSILYIPLIIGLFMSVCYLIACCITILIKIPYKLENSDSILITKLKSIKNKICPKITWHD